jgi:hypothetical protein
MAAPPSKRLLSLDDIPDAPSWLEKLVSPLNSFIKATAGALDSGITFSQQFAGEVKTVQITPPDDWIPLTLGTGVSRWSTGHELPAAYKDATGMVHSKGLAKAPSSNQSPFFVAATFPSGYAPALNQDAIPGGQGGTFIQWGIDTSGKVAITGGTLSANTFFSTYFPPFPAKDRTSPRWADPIDVRLGTPSKPFPGRPGQVLVLACRQTNAPTAPAVVTGVDWSAHVLDKKTPAVRLHRVWGLVPGVAYSLTLLIIPE